MGQVVTSAEMRRVVDANLKSYIEQGTAKYARLFGKSPTFVTYYAVDPDASMADVNLGGAIQLIGPESPVKYQIIHDFPIYGVSEADVSSAYDELRGIVSEGVRGEAYVLPGTVEVQENDFFVIDFLDTKILFRALSTNPDRIEGRSFFKIEYALDPSDPLALAQQVDKSYTFELGSVGTGSNPLIETDVAVLLREMEVIEEQLRASYWRAFYDRSSGTLLLRSGPVGAPIHDRGVDAFVQRNSLLGGAGYMKSRTVQPHTYADRGVFDDVVYGQLIYRAAERNAWPGSADLINGITLAYAKPTAPSSPFFAEFAIDGYYESIPSRDNVDIWIGSTTFLAEIDAKNYVADTPLVALAKRCLQPDGLGTDRIAALRDFIVLMNDDSLMRDRSSQFWLMPIILMRAKHFRNAARAIEA
jgi:hypothetical protein